MDHARVVLAGILPDRRDRLLFAMQRLEPEHFFQEVPQNLFVLLNRYYELTGGVLPKAVLSDGLANSDAGRLLLYEATYDSYAAEEVEADQWRYAVNELRERRAETLTGEALTNAYEIIERGLDVGRGEVLKGHKAARAYLYSELSLIDRLTSFEAAPEGDVRTEGKDILSEYATRKAKTELPGVLTGIPALDMATGGVQNGELMLVSGYTGSGKSMIVSQIAWNASVNQGLNAFIATSEVIRPQARRRLIARHSRLPQFDIPGGLNTRDIRDGTLTPDMESKFQAVVNDLTTNSSYGKLYLAQIPRGGTLGYVESRLVRVQTEWNIDVVVVDYLALLRPDRRRERTNEEMSDLMKDAKVLAVTFDGGRGVPLISPWAVNQSSYKEAVQKKEYSLANLGETAEAEKSSDLIVSLLWTSDTPRSVRTQVLKNRDGERVAAFELEVDFRSAYLGQKQERTSQEYLQDAVGVS